MSHESEYTNAILIGNIATKEALDMMSGHERFLIQTAIRSGETIGFGNLMAWLGSAWAVKLKQEGLDEQTAIEHVSGREPMLYPMSILGGPKK